MHFVMYSVFDKLNCFKNICLLKTTTTKTSVRKSGILSSTGKRGCENLQQGGRRSMVRRGGSWLCVFIWYPWVCLFFVWWITRTLKITISLHICKCHEGKLEAGQTGVRWVNVWIRRLEFVDSFVFTHICESNSAWAAYSEYMWVHTI